MTAGYALPGSFLWPSGWGRGVNVSVPNAETKMQKSAEKSSAGPESNLKGGPQNQLPFGPADQPKTAPKQSARLNDQIEVGGENASGFGAIAFSPSNRNWGESYGHGSRNAAERRAIKECASEAKDCELAVSFYRQCGAVVGDDNDVWGAGLGPTPQLALRDALATCASNNGKDCELERVTCTR